MNKKNQTHQKSIEQPSTENILFDINQLSQQLLQDAEKYSPLSVLPQINKVQAAQLQSYVQLLNKWNAVYNLSALKSINDMYILHLLDCLAPLQTMGDILNDFKLKPPINASGSHHHSDHNHINYNCLDVGSGAGLPALVWAIMMQGSENQDWHFSTIDAVQKKITFQQQVCLELGLKNASPFHQRIEDFQGSFDFITARAYSSIEKLLNDTAHLRNTTQAHHGYFLLKGQINDEVLAAKDKYINVQIKPLNIPYLKAERHLIYIPFSAV